MKFLLCLVALYISVYVVAGVDVSLHEKPMPGFARSMHNVHSNFNMMEMSLEVLEVNRSNTEAVVNALLDLEAVVHDIDDGEMFSDDGEHRLHGLRRVSELLHDERETVVAHAALVIGTANQNNPKAQQFALDQGVLEELLAALDARIHLLDSALSRRNCLTNRRGSRGDGSAATEVSAECVEEVVPSDRLESIRKLIYATSSIARQNDEGIKQFFSHKGHRTVHNLLSYLPPLPSSSAGDDDSLALRKALRLLDSIHTKTLTFVFDIVLLPEGEIDTHSILLREDSLIERVKHFAHSAVAGDARDRARDILSELTKDFASHREARVARESASSEFAADILEDNASDVQAKPRDKPLLLL